VPDKDMARNTDFCVFVGFL